jgi:hypothetical protein
LMRLRSVKLWQRQIQQAQRHAWNDVVAPIRKEFHEWTTMTTTTTIVHEQQQQPQQPPTKRPRVERCQEEADEEEYYTLQPPSCSSYPLELLPCLRISPPPTCRLDRHALTEALIWNIQQQQQKDQSCCTLLIPRFLDSLHLTLALLLRQCLQHEPSATLRHETRKLYKKNKRGTSLQESLLWWASQTQHYDSIVIVLEVRKNDIYMYMTIVSGERIFFSRRTSYLLTYYNRTLVDLRNVQSDKNSINSCKNGDVPTVSPYPYWWLGRRLRRLLPRRIVFVVCDSVTFPSLMIG